MKIPLKEHLVSGQDFFKCNDSVLIKFSLHCLIYTVYCSKNEMVSWMTENYLKNYSNDWLIVSGISQEKGKTLFLAFQICCMWFVQSVFPMLMVIFLEIYFLNSIIKLYFLFFFFFFFFWRARSSSYLPTDHVVHFSYNYSSTHGHF